MNYELAGWIGGLLLAICSLPQAYLAWKQGHSEGVAVGMLWLWGLGEVFTLIYVIPKKDWPLIINYTFNILCIAVISWYKFKPRKVVKEIDISVIKVD